MAHVEDKRKGAAGYDGPKPWKARYRTPDGQARSRQFARKADAERFLVKIESDKMTGGFVDPSAGRTTFRRYAEEWRSTQVHRPTTVAQVAGHLHRHVYPRIGDRPLAAVRPSEIQALVKALSVDLAPTTVETIYRHVSSVFRSAVRDRLIVHTPCEGVKLPKANAGRIVPLELEQVEAVAVAMPDRWQAAVWLAAGTGLRQGEVLGLTADRVDFLRRQVTVDRQMVTVVGSPPQFGPPKTQASYRTVPLPDSVAVALAEHMRHHPPGDDGLLFTTTDGEPVRRQRMADAWRRAAREAGLEEHTGFHALRHFYASLLIRHGESVKVVQSRLGHASAAETLDTYSHLWPDSDDRTRVAVDEVLGASRVLPASREAI